MVVVLLLLGLVALSALFWCAHHTHREVLCRRQGTRVRAAFEPRTTVAELRERCGADLPPRYPTPTVPAGDPDSAATVGPDAHGTGASWWV